MNSLVRLLLGASLLLLPGFTSIARAAAAAGKPAPDFSVTDISGKTQRLADHRGKVVVLEWISPGCPFVLRHYRSGNLPGTQAMAAAEGVVWLQVNSGSFGDLDAAATAEWQKKYGAVATAYIRDQDGKLGRLYGAQTTPHLYVIAKDGTLVYQGAIDDQPNASQAATPSAHNYVKAALAALKAGRPVETATTQPYGCGVKYGSDG